MTVVCGTDLSAPAAEAADVAARLAERLGEPLVLVHSVDRLGAGPGLERGEPEYEPLRRDLAAEADRLRALGAAVDTVLVADEAARALIAEAGYRSATLIVIAPVGRGGYARHLLGSTAARLVSRSAVPVLAVRSGAPFRAWLVGERPLRVTVGVDDSSGSAAALRWVERLRRVAPCDVTAVHVASPVDEQRRLGLPGPIDLEELSDEVRAVLHRQVAERVGTLAGGGEVDVVVRHGLGRIDVDLADAADRADADVIVVGSHQWSGLERLVRGSVSRAVLDSAEMSVACVPALHGGEHRRVGPVDTVLVATDFSERAAAAVPHAYALLGEGGTVHLLTVGGGDRSELERRLEALIPSDAPARGIRTVVHAVEGADAAEAICAAGERLLADVICLGTHGRSGVAEALMGSVAAGVLRGTRRPVLMVRG